MNVHRIQPRLELFDRTRSDQRRRHRRVTEDPGESQRADVKAAIGSGGAQGVDCLEGPLVHQVLVGLWTQVDARPRRWLLTEPVLPGQHASRRWTEGCDGHPLLRRERQDLVLDGPIQQAVGVLHRLIAVHAQAVAGGQRLAQLRRRHVRSEEHTSELQSHVNIVCRLLLEKKKKKNKIIFYRKKKKKK